VLHGAELRVLCNEQKLDDNRTATARIYSNMVTNMVTEWKYLNNSKLNCSTNDNQIGTTKNNYYDICLNSLLDDI
jgi:hypothetical protein